LGEYSNSRGKEYIEELEKNTDVKFIQYDLNPEELLTQAVERLKGPGGAIRRKIENQIVEPDKTLAQANGTSIFSGK
jgi:hypothetical protein